MKQATTDELTKKLYQIGEEKFVLEQQQQEIQRLEEEFHNHLQRKNRLLEEIRQTWRCGKMARQTEERMMHIRKEEQNLLEYFFEETEMLKKKTKQLETKEESLYYERKASYEKERTL